MNSGQNYLTDMPQNSLKVIVKWMRSALAPGV